MPEPDLAEFLKLSKPKRPPCAIGTALPRLNATDRTALDAALQTDQGIITNAAIAQWLSTRGVDVHLARVLSHRKQTCSCARDD